MTGFGGRFKVRDSMLFRVKNGSAQKRISGMLVQDLRNYYGSSGMPISKLPSSCVITLSYVGYHKLTGFLFVAPDSPEAPGLQASPADFDILKFYQVHLKAAGRGG